MLVIHKEKEIEKVPVGTLIPGDCFHLDSDRVFMLVEKRTNDNGIDTVFIIDLATGITKTISDTALVEVLGATLIVRPL